LATDPEGYSEVVNDLNEDLINFWEVLQDSETFAQFQRQVQAVPFSEDAWEKAIGGYPLERAVSFFIRVRQSLAGRQQSFAPLSRNRTRRGMNEQAAAWLSAVEGLPEVHERLKRIVILSDTAVNVIEKEDGPKTLFYCDPPYVHESRVSTTEFGNYEMDRDQHRQLLDTLKQCRGKVMLSGYRSKLYDMALQKWNRKEFRIANHASGSKRKDTETECVWCNF
jgi:DNA adenine methylase